MTITRERLLEYLSSDDIKMTYKSSDSGAGLSNMLHFGYVYVYSALGKTAQNRIDELAKALVKEVGNLTRRLLLQCTMRIHSTCLKNDLIMSIYLSK